MRARSPPIRTAGSSGPSTGNPAPSMMMRPPSIAEPGRTAVMLGLLDMDGSTDAYDGGARQRIMADGRGCGPIAASGTLIAGSRLSGIVQLQVPVEIVAPCLGGA